MIGIADASRRVGMFEKTLFAGFRDAQRVLAYEGRLAARVTSLAGWLDLSATRMVVPPDALMRSRHGFVRVEQT
jgi:hypothetical protein